MNELQKDVGIQFITIVVIYQELLGTKTSKMFDVILISTWSISRDSNFFNRFYVYAGLQN
jgi:hypothetical protein